MAVRLVQGDYLLVYVLQRDLHRVLAGEGRLARKHLVEHYARGIEVGLLVDRLALRLFGGDVIDGAHGLLAVVGLGRVAGELGYAEVGELYAAVIGYHDVLGLYVAVYEPLLMRVVETFQHVGDYAHGLLRIEPAALVHEVAERLSVDVFEHEIVDVAVAAHIVEGHDVFVFEGDHGLRLAGEPSQI